MFNFFVESSSILGDTVTITGDNYNHLKKVLRMKIKDEFLISHDGKSSLCELFEFTERPHHRRQNGIGCEESEFTSKLHH